jgi:two-component system sensor histidine kinase/response regulator
LACFVAPDVPMGLIGDASRLSQIVLNLVGNAIKFTRDGGVRVDVSREATIGDEIVLRFEISDTGIGIPKDVQETLFEKFRQADSSVTKKYGGTGLGLAISQQLAYLMNGDIGLESEVGVGRTFWFTVRLAQQEKTDEFAFVKLAPALAGRRALVVDNNLISRQVCGDYLVALGADVTQVDDTRAAHAALAEAKKSSPFDLAIIDHEILNADAEALGDSLRDAAEKDALKMVLTSTSDKLASHEGRPRTGMRCVAAQAAAHRTSVLGCLAYLYNVELSFSDRASSDAGQVNLPIDYTLRILVAEDNAVNQRLLEALLTGTGHEFDIVDNGVKAVEAVKGQLYDLVLMDVNMPEMGGIETTTRIRELPGENGVVPVIAVTAGAMREDREKCFAAGMNDHIGKPIDQRILFEKSPSGPEQISPVRSPRLRARAAVAKPKQQRKLVARRVPR